MHESACPRPDLPRARHARPTRTSRRARRSSASPHPEFGELRMQNVAPKLSVTPGAVALAGPALGEHNDEIYQGLLKISDAALADYAARGII